MKPTKLIYNGKRLKDFYVGASKWQVFKFRLRVFTERVLGFSLLVGIFIAIGSFLIPSEKVDAEYHAPKEVIKEVYVEVKAPILDRIAKCESPTGHYKNGQVVMNANKNGTVDIGRYQINSIWSKKATELGYDLTKEKDNEAFANWLYENKGTEPWVYSKQCWNK